MIKRAELSSEGKSVGFRCPACGHAHYACIDPAAPSKRRCSWNNDFENPTIDGSVDVESYRYPRFGSQADRDECDKLLQQGSAAVIKSRFGTKCHSAVTNGKIYYYLDSRHALAGQTVELPEWTKKN